MSPVLLGWWMVDSPAPQCCSCFRLVAAARGRVGCCRWDLPNLLRRKKLKCDYVSYVKFFSAGEIPRSNLTTSPCLSQRHFTSFKPQQHADKHHTLPLDIP